MEKRLDPRIKRTRSLLKTALLNLIDETGFDAITVRDLTDRAEINRATFYQHYLDKFDLLEKSIKNELQDLVTTVEPRNREEFTITGGEPSPIHIRLFEYISEHAYFFQVMMGKNGVPSFQHQVASQIQDFMSEVLDHMHPDFKDAHVPKDFFTHYVAAAMIGLGMYWLESGMKYSPRYMAEKASYLTIWGPVNAIGLR